MAVFNCKNADDVLKAVKDYNVSFVQFWFIDILGVLKSFQVTPRELEAAFEEGMGFDGSSITGFTKIQESDMVAYRTRPPSSLWPGGPPTVRSPACSATCAAPTARRLRPTAASS